MKKSLQTLLAALVLGFFTAAAAAAEAGAAAKPEADGTFLLTVILHHNQSMTLAQIKAHQEKTGFWHMFPPAGVKVVSWYAVMGVGQVITLRVPPDKLREVNLAVEYGAWGAFHSEFYPTYDLWPVMKRHVGH